MQRKISKKLILLLAIVLVLGAGVSYLLKSEQALQFAFNVAAKTVGDKLSAEKISGCLAGPIKIEKFYFENKKLAVSADSVQLDWRISRLLLGEINILKTYVNDLTIEIKKSAPIKIKTKSKINLNKDLKNLRSHLPHNLKLEDLQLYNVALQQSPDLPQINFEHVLLKLHTKCRAIAFLKCEVKAQDASFSINGSLEKELAFNWKLYLPKIETFFPDTEGKLDWNGEASGNLATPEVSTMINTSNFKYQGISFGKLAGDFNLDFSAQKKSQFNLAITKPKFNSVGFDKLNFSGDAQAVNTGGQGIKANIEIEPTKIYLLDDTNNFLKIASGSIQANFDDQGLVTKSSVSIENYNPISFELNLPKLKSIFDLLADQKMDGNLSWSTKDLVFLQSIIPKAKNAQGELNLNYSISGTTYKPIFTGTGKITNGKIQITELNTQLKNINLSVNGSNNNLTYQGSVTSGEGSLELSGEASLAQNIETKTQLNGSNFLVSNTDGYKLTVSPQLVLQTKGSALDLTGKISVPQANIKPAYLSGDALLPSEIVYVDDEGKEENPISYDLSASIQLVLGENVLIDIMGLKGNLLGNLQINDEPKKNTIATGKLYLKNGVFNAYGQELKISKGEMGFINSSIDNPEVNVEAIRTFKPAASGSNFGSQQNDLTVGVKMIGLLNNAKMELFSIPPGMLKADILSYLIFGQSSKQISENKGQLLLKAASAMNFTGSGGFGTMFGDFKEKLALDEFDVQTTDRISTDKSDVGQELSQGNLANSASSTNTVTSNTSLALGKYLSPKLYVSYSIGLTEPVNILKIKYFMGRYWSVQSESSALGGGIDLFYSIEHD